MTGGPGGLEPSASTADFLASCARLARVLLDLAEAVSRWADDLAGVPLPDSVVCPLRMASGTLSGAAPAVSTAAVCAAHAAQAASASLNPPGRVCWPSWAKRERAAPASAKPPQRSESRA